MDKLTDVRLCGQKATGKMPSPNSPLARGKGLLIIDLLVPEGVMFG